MEDKVKYVNSPEDKRFLKNFCLYVLTVILMVSLCVCAKTSHDELVRNGKTIDHNGDIVDDPMSEVIVEPEEEKAVVLRRVR